MAEVSLQKILYWVLVAYLIFVVIVLLQKVFGGSLGFEELTIALLVANLGYSFYLGNKLNHHLGECSMLNRHPRKK